jgi:hypothetical protein
VSRYLALPHLIVRKESVSWLASSWRAVSTPHS